MNYNLSPPKPGPPAWPLALGGFIALFLLRIYLHLTCSGILWNIIGKHLFDLAFGLATLGLIAWAVVDLIRSLPELPLTPAPTPEPPADVRFSTENITQTFIASIPQMTSELNLELATATQTEIFERKDDSRLWGWFDLGANVARIQVTVTYRYHVQLYDVWRLRIEGNTLIVHAPAIRASLPPAIQTDQMVQETSRGWGRLPPTTLLAELHRDLTPTLTQYATDPRRIALVRESCRQSIAAFVQRWLSGEPGEQASKITAIQVHFADEATSLPPPLWKRIEANSDTPPE